MKAKALFLSLFLSVSAFAQTNNPSTILETIGATLGSVSNWSAYPYFTYAPDSPKKYGGGALAIYNVTQNFGAGIGIDWLGGFNMVNGNVSLKLPTHPFTFLGWSNVTVTPFGIAGIGTPMGGAGKANGNVSTIAGAGTAIDLFLVKGFQASIGYEFSEWSGASAFSGAHHHVFFGFRKGF